MALSTHANANANANANAIVNPNPSSDTRWLQKGMAYYSKEDYTKAVAIFTKVANSCTCLVPVRKQSCPCTSLLDAIEKNKLKEELKKKCICSARSHQRCRNSIHLDALDSLAAAHEKEGRLEQVLHDAETMIGLSPRDPRGYLRLGKVLRLKGTLRQAYYVYDRGGQLVKEKNPTHPLLQILQELSIKTKGLIKYDPICTFPLELVIMIFRYIDFRSLCRSRCVSTTWRDYLTNAKRARKESAIYDLWCAPTFSFDFLSPRVHVSQLTFKNYASYGNHSITHLAISDTKRFGLDPQKLHLILRLCPKLKNLILRGPGFGPLGLVSDNIPLPKLTKLFLGSDILCTPGFLRQILVASARTIQELSVFSIGDPGSETHQSHVLTQIPLLRELKVLRIASQKRVQWLNVIPLINNTPNLEELWVNNLALNLTQGSQPMCRWEKLRSFSLKCPGLNTSSAMLPRPPLFPPSIEEICIDGRQAQEFVAKHILSTTVPFRSLRRFQYIGHAPLFPASLRILLNPSIESGSLRELELKPFSHEVLSRSEILAHGDWFRSPHLEFLGLGGLNNSLCNTAEVLLVDLSSRFPNLQTLDIGHEQIADAVLGGLMQQGLKTVYHRQGLLKEDLREWAEENTGAKVVYGSYLLNVPDSWHKWYRDAAQDESEY
ncbi:hypothetical protein F4810DRAFT_652397 [Camillea tinctor]|nr:hypothetical protein F4810DRAFT_652397 [Camillea tinctor]